MILADEPTGALDPITSREVLALFKELHEDKGVAFLIVTHRAEVAAFCDRSLELRDGRFIAQHGADFEVTDLAESRELIVDDIGTVFSPDILLEMGGAGRYEVEVGDGRLVLVSAEENESLLVGGKHWPRYQHATTYRMKKHNFVQIVAQVGPWCDQTVGSLNV